jgi:hypothetical protein
MANPAGHSAERPNGAEESTMQPTLSRSFLPAWLGEVKSYGVMLMIGFRPAPMVPSGQRSRRTDIVLNMFILQIGGLIGARASTSFTIGSQP